MVDVVIFIRDIDEPPKCTISTQSAIKVDDPIGTLVLDSTCIDPDVDSDLVRKLSVYIQPTSNNLQSEGK